MRTVTRAECQERGPFLTIDIEGNAFLYRMVRSIVGTLVLVGSGQVSLEGFEEMMQARDRSRIRQVAPAHGLCLMHVDYETRDDTTQPAIRTMDLSRSV